MQELSVKRTLLLEGRCHINEALQAQHHGCMALLLTHTEGAQHPEEPVDTRSRSALQEEGEEGTQRAEERGAARVLVDTTISYVPKMVENIQSQSLYVTA